jgi:hypothetical protein
MPAPQLEPPACDEQAGSEVAVQAAEAVELLIAELEDLRLVKHRHTLHDPFTWLHNEDSVRYLQWTPGFEAVCPGSEMLYVIGDTQVTWCKEPEGCEPGKYVRDAIVAALDWAAQWFKCDDAVFMAQTSGLARFEHFVVSKGNGSRLLDTCMVLSDAMPYRDGDGRPRVLVGYDEDYKPCYEYVQRLVTMAFRGTLPKIFLKGREQEVACHEPETCQQDKRCVCAKHVRWATREVDAADKNKKLERLVERVERLAGQGEPGPSHKAKTHAEGNRESNALMGNQVVQARTRRAAM